MYLFMDSWIKEGRKGGKGESDDDGDDQLDFSIEKSGEESRLGSRGSEAWRPWKTRVRTRSTRRMRLRLVLSAAPPIPPWNPHSRTLSTAVRTSSAKSFAHRSELPLQREIKRLMTCEGDLEEKGRGGVSSAHVTGVTEGLSGEVERIGLSGGGFCSCAVETFGGGGCASDHHRARPLGHVGVSLLRVDRRDAEQTEELGDEPVGIEGGEVGATPGEHLSQ